MTKKVIWIWIGTLALALALSLSGCSGPSGASAGAASDSEPMQATSSPEVAVVEPARLDGARLESEAIRVVES